MFKKSASCVIHNVNMSTQHLFLFLIDNLWKHDNIVIPDRKLKSFANVLVVPACIESRQCGLTIGFTGSSDDPEEFFHGRMSKVSKSSIFLKIVDKILIMLKIAYFRQAKKLFLSLIIIWWATISFYIFGWKGLFSTDYRQSLYFIIACLKIKINKDLYFILLWEFAIFLC